MKRINVTFYDETYDKLDTRRQNNGGKSIAHGVRELVDLGFRTEEALQKNDKNGIKNDSEMLIAMLKKNLIWALEARLLTRYLVENLPGMDREKQIETLEKYKQSAVDYIEGMFDEKNK